jgi:pyruvate/2-oxoglutarate dehydrogenase complex dihydrolipoamide acyltransferase (E2) component
MQVEILLPSLGDDDDAVAGGTISEWLVSDGSPVAEGDDLLELTTDKAAFVLPAPQSGTLVERKVKDGDDVKVGDVICIFEV